MFNVAPLHGPSLPPSVNKTAEAVQTWAGVSLLTTERPLSGTSALIVGAGVIGLSIAWLLARAGAKVCVRDADIPGKGASWAAAGLLAPTFEAFSQAHGPIRPELLRACLAGQDGWAEFGASLQAVAACDVGLDTRAALAIAMTQADESRLAHLAQESARHQLGVKELAARDWPVWLSGDARAVFALQADHQVDNRALLKALWQVCQRAGVMAVPRPWHPDEMVEAAGDSDCLVLASGHSLARWAEADGALAAAKHIVPVKGQMLSLTVGRSNGGESDYRSRDLPDRVLRHDGLYIAPKADRIVIGASLEAGADDLTLNDAVLADLLSCACALVPGLSGLDLSEQWAGVRPAVTDGLPIVGPLESSHAQSASALPTFLAVGHYRNGVLLAPITAEIVLYQVLTALGQRSDWSEVHAERLSPLVASLSPKRFERVPLSGGDQADQ